ncbi:MAG: diacylglycerol kinase family protein [Planctomycetota bacterium]
MNVLIFANPFSGHGPNRKRVGQLEAALEARGVDVRVVWQPQERIATLREVQGDDTVVIAAGGDGSIADVVNDMNAADRLGLRFATLPVGNENLFAQEFGFTLKAEPMAEAIGRGEARPIDLVRVRSVVPGDDNSSASRLDDDRSAAADSAAPERPDEEPPVDRLLTLMVSTGFDADVVHRMDRWRRGLPDGQLHRVGKKSYVVRTLDAIRRYRYPGVAVVADGKRYTGHQAYVFNLPRYGGGLKFAPDARGDDQQLDWLVFERPGFLRLLGYHGLVVLGRHSRAKTVAAGRASHVTLLPADDQPVPTQADGDPVGHTPLDLTVLPGALRVIAV